MLTSDQIWIEEGEESKYTEAKRVGIDYATDEYRDKLWRFIIKG